MLCPCQSGLAHQECCKPLLEGSRYAANAEQLMRSRYTAFYLGDDDYLKKTWHSNFVPNNLGSNEKTKWLGLSVLDFIDGEASATVEFEATFLSNGVVNGLHERSRFMKQQGQWLYTDGDQLPVSFKPWKPGRNDSCPCGSGKKFKRCCA